MRPLWNRLDQYIYREIHMPFALAMLVYNGIFFIRSFVQVAQLGGEFEIPLRTFLILFLSVVPEILYITIPMSFLFATIAAISRLSSDSELIAPQSAGLGFQRLNRPILIYGLLCSLFCLALSQWGEPLLKQNRVRHFEAFMQTVAAPSLTPGVITNLDKGSILFIESLENQVPRNLIMLGQKDGKSTMTYAETMEMFRSADKSIKIQLTNGNEKRIDPQGSEGPQIARFNKMTMDFPAPTAGEIKGLSTDPFETILGHDLLRQWREGKLDTEGAIHFWQRFHFPLASFLLALFALPLAGKHVRLKRGNGFGLSLILILVYFFLAKTSESLAERGSLPASLSTAMANCFFLITGLWLMARRHQLTRERQWNPIPKLFRGIFFMFRAIQEKFTGWRKWDTTQIQLATHKPFRPRRFPSRIDRYILNKFIVTFLLIQTSMLGLITLIEYTEISKYVHRNNVDTMVLLKYLFFKIPEFLNTTMFLGLLIAVLVTMSVMSKNQEITAIRAGGGSLKRLCMPILLLGAMVSVALFYVENNLFPTVNKRALKLRYEIKNTNPGLFHKNWIRLNNGDFLNFEYYNPSERSMFNTVWYAVDLNSRGVHTRTQADKLTLDANGQWKTESTAQRWDFKEENNLIKPVPTELEPGEVLNLSIDHEDLALRERKPAEFSISEFKTFIEYVKTLGVYHPKFDTELYAKIAQPLLPFIMILLAAPLGFQFGRKGTFFGVATGLVLGLAFWASHEFFLQLGRIGLLPPALAAWSVLLLFWVTAVFRFVQMEP